MKAVQIKSFGGPEQLYIGEYEQPVPGPNELLVQIEATALNRADTLQRMGKYPPPEGESEIMGLEMAGTVVGKGQLVHRWQLGDKVCGLLGGGGYATHATIPEGMALPWPKGFDAQKATAVPEVFLTAFQALRWLAQLKEGERFLVHAGASGVGTAAIQLAKAMGVEVLATASAGKHELCRSLGASLLVDYQSEDFAERIEAYTEGAGVDVILDVVGGPYFQQNLQTLATDGRLVMLAFLGGVKPESVNLTPILRKRLSVMGSTLRSRALSYKVRLSQDLYRFAWLLFEQGTLRPVVDRVYDWSQVADAHRYMESNKSQGKIILKVQ